MRDGLRPWDHHGTTIFQGAVTPRPGHCYAICALDLLDHQLEMSDIDEDEKVAVAIDLREINPACIVPDEDYFCLGLSGPNEQFGLPSAQEMADLIGEGRPYASGGEWAEANRLGAQPGIVEACMSGFQKVALRGTIPPYALRIVEMKSWESELHGRHYSGRSFIPPPP